MTQTNDPSWVRVIRFSVARLPAPWRPLTLRLRSSSVDLAGTFVIFVTLDVWSSTRA